MQTEWRTTMADFRTFKRFVAKWIRKFGLTNYRVICLHKDNTEAPGAYGWFQSQGNVANIGLGAVWDQPITTKALELAACHEVIHLLLDDLTSAASNRFCPAGLIDAMEEEVIARLEKVLLNAKEVVE
jgi:hypothetical protein